MNPYTQDVTQQESALMNQQNQTAQSGQLGTAISSGAFGGDRAGVAAANLAGQQSLAYGNAMAPILQQGYNTALSTAQQQQGVTLAAQQADAARLSAAGQQIANIGTQGQTAGLAGAQAQMAAGQVGQQTTQAGDTALYNQFLQQQSYPFQTAQFLANIAEGTGALSGQTTTTTQPSSFFSDRRLKENIKKIGTAKNGLPIYSFNYKEDPEKVSRLGFMADEVEKKHPEAVGLAAGFKTVDYEKAARPKRYAGGLLADSTGGLVTDDSRGGFDQGGSPGDWAAILQQHEGMYGPQAGGLYGGSAQATPGKPSYVPSSSVPQHQPLHPGNIPALPQSGLKQAIGDATQAESLYKMGTDPKGLGAAIYGKVAGSATPAPAAPAPAVTAPPTAEPDWNSMSDSAIDSAVDAEPLARGGLADGGDPEGLYQAPGAGLSIPNENQTAQNLSEQKAEAPQSSGSSSSGNGLGDALKLAGLVLPFFNFADGGLVRRRREDGGPVAEDLEFARGGLADGGAPVVPFDPDYVGSPGDADGANLGYLNPDLPVGDLSEGLSPSRIREAVVQQPYVIPPFRADSVKKDSAAPGIGRFPGIGSFPDASNTVSDASNTVPDAQPGLRPSVAPETPQEADVPLPPRRPKGLGLDATPPVSDASAPGLAPGLAPQATAATAPASAPEAGFGPALGFTFQHEGGLNPSDSNGSPSNFGINQAAHPNIDVTKLSKDQAAAIYKSEYWDAIGGDKVPPALQTMAFDTAVMSGPAKAKELIAASGGDPDKFMQLRQAFQSHLLASDPDKYGKYASAWAQRNKDLLGGGGGDNAGAGLAGGIQRFAQNAGQTMSDAGSGAMDAITQGGQKAGNWFDSNRGWMVPLLTGLGGMASSNSRYLGSAMLQGLGGGAQAYAKEQQAEAQLAQTKAQTGHTNTVTSSQILENYKNLGFKDPGTGEPVQMLINGNGVPERVRYSEWVRRSAAGEKFSAVNPSQDLGASQAASSPGVAPPATGGPARPAASAPVSTAMPTSTNPGLHYSPANRELAADDQVGNLWSHPGGQKASEEYETNTIKNANAANAATQGLQKQASATADVIRAGGFGQMGAGFDSRQYALNTGNTAAAILGLGDNYFGGDTSAAAVQQKMAVLNAASAAHGNGVNAYAGLEQMLLAQPGGNMPSDAAASITAQMLSDQQRSKDALDDMKLHEKAGATSYRNAGTAFNNDKPPAEYAREQGMLKEMIASESPLFKTLVSGSVSPDQIKQYFKVHADKFPPGFERYFLGGH